MRRILPYPRFIMCPPLIPTPEHPIWLSNKRKEQPTKCFETTLTKVIRKSSSLWLHIAPTICNKLLSSSYCLRCIHNLKFPINHGCIVPSFFTNANNQKNNVMCLSIPLHQLHGCAHINPIHTSRLSPLMLSPHLIRPHLQSSHTHSHTSTPTPSVSNTLALWLFPILHPPTLPPFFSQLRTHTSPPTSLTIFIPSQPSTHTHTNHITTQWIFLRCVDRIFPIFSFLLVPSKALSSQHRYPHLFFFFPFFLSKNNKIYFIVFSFLWYCTLFCVDGHFWVRL